MKLIEKIKKPSLSLPSLPFLSKSSLSVYLTPHFVRILELDKDGVPTFEPVEFEWHDKREEEKLNILREFVEKLGLKGKKAHTCITAKNGILKVHKFPATLSRKDLQEAIDTFIRIEKENIKEESIYDYYVWESEDKRFKIIALVIVRRVFYEELRKFIESAGLKLGIVDYEVSTIVNGGLLFNLREPFAILYVDHHESLFVYYTGQSIVYNISNFSLREYLQTKDDFLLEEFFIEIKNLLLVNEVNALYLAGKVIEHEELFEKLMTNLPILSPLEPPHLRASFFIPYTLSMRGLKGV
ncbi:MAG: pilus assembly protein PilM [Aquificae bacterium]|nr:pilus assembly protein PilM [Aquificota bacterium]